MNFGVRVDEVRTSKEMLYAKLKSFIIYHYETISLTPTIINLR